MSDSLCQTFARIRKAMCEYRDFWDRKRLDPWRRSPATGEKSYSLRYIVVKCDRSSQAQNLFWAAEAGP